jgi:hypothetical protein
MAVLESKYRRRAKNFATAIVANARLGQAQPAGNAARAALASTEQRVTDAKRRAMPLVCTWGANGNPKALAVSRTIAAAMATRWPAGRPLEGRGPPRAVSKPDSRPGCGRLGGAQSNESASRAIAHGSPPPDPQPLLRMA